MINKEAKLSEKIFSSDIDKASTRDGFGVGITKAGNVNEKIVVLCADVAESTRASKFQKEFPERFIEMGVAEQNMAAVASGMASAGKIPFIVSYAVFSPGRNFEQIRTTIALNNVPVKICGMHGGISVGADGATHQMLEDIGMMRMLPGMKIIVPGDAEEARKATVAAAETEGPVYIRFCRAETPVFSTPDTPFEIGKALILFDSEQPKIAIFSTGVLSYSALESASILAKEDIQTIVLHVPTVKPLDAKSILAAACRVHKIVTIEEHQIAGGFGSAIAELLSEIHPMPIKMIGIQDKFGQSGSSEELLEHYGLNTQKTTETIRDFISA